MIWMTCSCMCRPCAKHSNGQCTLIQTTIDTTIKTRTSLKISQTKLLRKYLRLSTLTL